MTLAVAMIVVGLWTAIAGLKLGHNAAQAPDPVAFLAVPLGDMVIFGTLVALAAFYRRRKEAHRRFMLLRALQVGTLPPTKERLPVGCEK